MKAIPEIGDIWYNYTDKVYYLILDGDTPTKYGSAYRFLVLDNGEYDAAGSAHFEHFCEFIQ